MGLKLVGRIVGASGKAQGLGTLIRDVSEALKAPRLEAAVEDEASSYDRAVDGLNRLPRPAMALGSMGLFSYAMVDPAGFALRMDGLDHIPEPLWWLMGAVVSFYFGAREAHYLRRRRPVIGVLQDSDSANETAPDPVTGIEEPVRHAGPGDANPALADWARSAR